MRPWLAAAAALALAACGGGEILVLDAPASNVAGQPGSAGAGQAGAAGKAGAPGGQAGAAGQAGAPPEPPPSQLARCQGSDQAFARRAIEAVLGRKPRGQAEVQVLVDLMNDVDRLAGPELARNGPPGADLRPARRVAVVTLMGREEYLFRWIDVYRDALRVQRTEDQANPGCYGSTRRTDGTSVAEMVRDQPPDLVEGDGAGAFTMRDLLLSSLKLDDISPVYIANLFSMLALTYPGANAAPDKLELARRSDFGAWFDGVYIRRDAVCLRCHNSEFSVTFSEDPAKNRHFPVPGRLDKSLFGDSAGPPPDGSIDGAARMHAPLRYDGFVNAGTARPWGWEPACGFFAARGDVPPDIAKVDAKFGNFSGVRTSAWDLASSLQDGFRKLRLHGLSRGPNNEIPDPDEAFAYLTASSIVEQIWREVMGTPLTIANYFPRNAAARDQLLSLTEAFIAHGFSHRELLFQILQSPYFNLEAPDSSCWDSPYALPAIFDPWTTADPDASHRGNSPADAISPLSGRTAAQAAYRALGWPSPPQSAFPARDAPEGEFQASIGVFLKNAEPGFRGFDFQARLGWESRFGACKKLFTNVSPDFLDELVAEGQKQPDATALDLIVALKDRLLGEASIDDPDERDEIAAILGVSLDSPASGVPELALRRVCGVMLASPQFLLRGLLPPDQTTLPRITPPGTSYRDHCEAMAAIGLPDQLSLTCNDASLSLSLPGP